MADLPDIADLEDEQTEGWFIDSFFTPILNVIRQLPGGAAPTILTIASGSVTPTYGAHTIDTEGSAAADDLTHIATDNHPPGRILTILQTDPARVVTVRHAEGGTGEIQLRDGQDVALTGIAIRLRRDASGAWVEEARSGITAAVLPTLLVEDHKTSGTAGGTFTAGDWRTRDLNTAVVNTITGASLASNQVTLPAGTYEVVARSPAQDGAGTANPHQARLYDVTNGAELLRGTSQNTGYGINTVSVIQGRFTLAATAALEVQHRITTTRSTDGFGRAASFGTEIYTQLLLRKVA